MIDLQKTALEQFEKLDKRFLLKNGLDLNFEIINPLSNLGILEPYKKDYTEFFEDPLVVSLMAKNASVFKLNISDLKAENFKNSKFLNSILIIEVEKSIDEGFLLNNLDGLSNYAALIICHEHAKLELVANLKSNFQVAIYEYFKTEAQGNSIIFVDNQLGLGYLNVKAFMIGNAAQHDFNIYVKSQAQKTYLYVMNHFKVANCAGEIWIDGILDQAAYAKIIGAINIDLSAGNTDSYMKKEILLIDDKSKLDCVPALEIKTNDVKAGHGVSVSKFDKDKKFYLQSRGLNENQVIELVCNGLLSKSIDKIQDESLQAIIKQNFEC